MLLKLDLNDAQILEKTDNEQLGLFVSNEWKRLIDPYTPRDTATLMQNVEKKPWQLHYKEPYAHYMYMGIVYVDPVYGVSGFFDPEYGFWSRFGVKKVPSGRTFDYQRNNPFSTDHWDEKAAEAGQLNKLCQSINGFLRR